MRVAPNTPPTNLHVDLDKLFPEGVPQELTALSPPDAMVPQTNISVQLTPPPAPSTPPIALGGVSVVRLSSITRSTAARESALGKSDAEVLTAAYNAVVRELHLRGSQGDAVKDFVERIALSETTRLRPGAENQRRFGDAERSGEYRCGLELQRGHPIRDALEAIGNFHERQASPELLHTVRTRAVELLVETGYAQADAEKAAGELILNRLHP